MTLSCTAGTAQDHQGVAAAAAAVKAAETVALVTAQDHQGVAAAAAAVKAAETVALVTAQCFCKGT